MQLVDVVKRSRVRLSDVQLSDIRPDRPYRSQVKASIAEALVHIWLSNAERRDQKFILDDAPREQNGYVLLPKNYGILAFNGRKLIAEFDSLFIYDGRPSVVEVKSNGFDPDSLKMHIRKTLATARRIYEKNNVGMLLFFPIYSQFRAGLANEMQREHRQMQCVDLGYTRKELEEKTTEFYKRLRKNK